MKTKFVALVVVFAGMASGLFAQGANEKLGSDPNECLKNYSLYLEFYKQKNYTDALPWWKKAVAICPKYSKNFWMHGESMYQSFIGEATDPVRKEVLIDSLMWIYDQRIEHFSDDPRTPVGYVIGLKGLSLLQYRREEFRKSYELLGQAVDQLGIKSEAAFLLTYMMCSRQLFLDNEISAEQVLTDYEKTMAIVDANLKLTPNDQGFITTYDGIERYFSTSGAASCEALVALYTPKFEALRDNVEWLKKITRQLRKGDCTDSKVFSDASEALFKIEPNADAAHNLAAFFLRKQDYEKANDYLMKAINLGQQSEELADMYYEAAYIQYMYYKDYQKVRTFANKAVEARTNWGEPYLLIGKAFIDSRNDTFSDEWDRSTVFWVAVDKFIKAKSVDPESTEKANELINTYSQYFPMNELVFMRTHKEGDTYLVKGWINENTKVRSKK